MGWRSVGCAVLLLACSREDAAQRGPESSASSKVERAASSAAQVPAAPSASPASASPATVSCIGPQSAKQFVVYLHGMDSEPPSEQELGNRRVLQAIAQRQSVRFALPRATRACPKQPGSMCWGWSFNDEELQRAATAIVGAATQCFPKQDYGLLGFSNGGYLLNQLLRSCRLKPLLPRGRWMLGVGSAKFQGELEAEPKSLAGCGRLSLLIGTADKYNFDPKHHLFEALRAKGADVVRQEFAGGHSLEETSLGLALERSSSPHPQTR